MKAERAAIEAEIERLLCILDNMDGDPDLEPEPSEEQHDAEGRADLEQRACARMVRNCRKGEAKGSATTLISRPTALARHALERKKKPVASGETTG